MPIANRLYAEFLGTAWLVLGGCGSAVLAAGFPQLGIGFAGVALAFGLTVLTMVYALGPVSGGHFNPAVTVGLACSRRFPWSDVVQYVVAQVLGGIVGAAILYVGPPARPAPTSAASPPTAMASTRPASTGCSLRRSSRSP
jgi:aquaporin Z